MSTTAVTTNTTPLARLRQLLPATIVAAGVIAGAMILTAAAANADTLGPNSKVHAWCDGLGGDFTYDGDGKSTCCYQSLNPAVPGRVCDHYQDGVFVYTDSTRPTTTRPPVVQTGPPVTRRARSAAT